MVHECVSVQVGHIYINYMWKIYMGGEGRGGGGAEVYQNKGGCGGKSAGRFLGRG